MHRLKRAKLDGFTVCDAVLSCGVDMMLRQGLCDNCARNLFQYTCFMCIPDNDRAAFALYSPAHTGCNPGSTASRR